MNLLHLRYVVEVEKTGSITKAAKNLFMGQPNLSKAIKELESEIGISIFRRTAQGVEPTAMGAQFLTYAKTILSQIDELESLYKPQKESEFRFEISVPRATYLSVAFAQFINEAPKDKPMIINFRESASIEAINQVANSESQLGIIRYQDIHEQYFLQFIKNMRLSFEPLWNFRMCLLMDRDHPLALAGDIPYHLLDGFIEIVHGDIEVPSLSMSEINRCAKMKSHKKKISIFDRGSQFNLLKGIKGSYMWVSPVPYQILSENGLVLKECSMAARSKDVVIYKSDHIITEQERIFLQIAKKYTRNPGQL